jgi:hypothetical protein
MHHSSFHQLIWGLTSYNALTATRLPVATAIRSRVEKRGVTLNVKQDFRIQALILKISPVVDYFILIVLSSKPYWRHGASIRKFGPFKTVAEDGQ